MNQPYPPPGNSGQFMPNGRPRPGAGPAGPPSDAPGFQARPQQVDYGVPRLYDTSVRPASGLTRQRWAPASITQPQQAQPQSAWATQTRRAQEVSQQGGKVPISTIVAWIGAAVIAAGALLGLGLMMLLIFGPGSQLSIGTLPVFAFFAGISLVIIIGVIAIADRWDPQPFPLLVIALLWGIGISTIVALLLNDGFSALVYAFTGADGLTQLISAAIGAPLIEETGKGLGLVLLFLLGRKYFNGPLDGLIYGALIGGGFAFTENILYYMVQYASFGGEEAMKLIFQRGLLGIFGHPIYTSLTGVIMGLVARKWGTLPGALSFLVATWPGMFLHAMWNGGGFFVGAIFGDTGYYVIMYGSQFFLYALWIGLIVWLMLDESRLTRVRLGDYANQGWLTHQEVDMLATWKGRREGRRWARSIGAALVMRRFIKESAELASTRQRLLADGASPGAQREEQRLLNRLTGNRRELLSYARH